LLLALGACTAQKVRLYEGPERPREEIAVLVVEGMGYDTSGGPEEVTSDAWLIEADGKPIDKARLAEFAPGRHGVVVHWVWYDLVSRGLGDKRRPSHEGKSEFTFTAEANKSYVLDWNYWKQDAPSGIKLRK